MEMPKMWQPYSHAPNRMPLVWGKDTQKTTRILKTLRIKHMYIT